MFPPFTRRRRRRPQRDAEPPAIGELQERTGRERLTADFERNLALVRDLFGGTSDLVVREFMLGEGPAQRAAVVYLDGLVDEQLAADDILAVLFTCAPTRKFLGIRTSHDPHLPARVAVPHVTLTTDLGEIGTALTGGHTLLLVEGEEEGVLCATAGFQHRAVEEPTSESGVRVPREGFTEVIAVNRSLIRRRLRDPRLCFLQLQVGAVTKTSVEIAYVRGLAAESLVAEVKQRIERLQIDGVLESGYIEEMIVDNPRSIFPQMRRTERPDVVTAALLEGRIAILTDGSPFVLTAPITLPELLHAAEDYYMHWGISSFIRCFRYVAYLVAIFGPGVYVALVTYHHELIPTSLLHDVAASREGVPFPAALEALFMLSVFEILREAGIRLPRIVGSAMTIVGALVLGQQTVEAGIASPLMVVVVAGTAIASFSSPSYALDASSRLLRFLFVLAAAMLGLFGIFVAACLVLMHLCALRSFGVPYLSPFAPMQPGQVKDTVFRMPWWMLRTRPGYLPVRDKRRQGGAPRLRPRDGRGAP